MIKCSSGHNNDSLDNVRMDIKVNWLFWGQCQTCKSDIIFVKDKKGLRRPTKKEMIKIKELWRK